MPTLYILAGSNGVGKTTFANRSNYVMKTKIEDWDESFLDVEDYQVERALNNAAIDAIRRARQFGTSYVIEEDGHTKCIPANETGPYEKVLQENVERLS